MSEATRYTSCGHPCAANLRTFTARVLADLTAIRTAVVGITAQLDADAGVTDTDYNSLDPAAITTVALTES